MTPLGKPLVFYLKYMAEMNRIYDHAEGEEPDLTELNDPDHVREMARTVGAAASEEASDFLEQCGRAIEDHFTGLKIATLSRKRSRAYVKTYWEWGARVNASAVPNGWFSCGVALTAPPMVRISLAKDVCGVVVPWLWSRGGRKAADEVWRILGAWAHSLRDGGLVEESGTVALACIPIKAQPPEKFDVDRDPLIAEVIKTFARIGSEHTKAIASFVGGLNEPDES